MDKQKSFGRTEAFLPSGRCSQNIDFSNMVNLTSQMWNILWPGFLYLDQKLEELGLQFNNMVVDL